MKTKTVLAGSFIILALVIVAGAVWWCLRPQVITFDDGSTLTLLSVDYGKHHVAPRVSGTARRGRTFSTANDTLVAWVLQKYASGQWESFQYLVYDEAGTACVNSWNASSGNGRGNEIVAIRLPAFPRRQSEFIIRVEEQSSGGMDFADKKFVIHSPHGSYLQWTPESLPDTEDDEDVSVTLTRVLAGAQMPYTINNDDPDDAMNKGVQATFQVQRNGHPVITWQPVAVQITDATGNSVDAIIANNQWQNENDTVLFQYGLWPDEAAWKMRFEFSQQSDFAPGELWSLSNVPVQPGKYQDFWNYRRQSQNNAPFAETDLNGYHLKVFPAKEFTDMPPNGNPQGGLSIQVTPALPDGMRLTIAKLTDDQTNDIGFWENSYNPTRDMTLHQCQLRDISGLTNLNLTLALHKSRFVEFMVKPEMAPPENSQQ